MIQYLVMYEPAYSSKNKLEEQIKAYLCLHNRKLIKANEAQTFRNQVIYDLAKINEQHPRCKPVSAYWWEAEHPDEGEEYLERWILSFGGASICNFKMVAGQEVEI